MIDFIVFSTLILLTGFFVATEFAIVKIRSSKLEELENEGVIGAKSAKHVKSHLDEYLSACQLGITVTALGIGMIGEKTFKPLILPLLDLMKVPVDWSGTIVITMSFVLATFLHVVIGELAPKTLALQKAEKITLLFSRPIILFYKFMYPFIWLLNGSARLIVKMFGLVRPEDDKELNHSVAELRILLRESDAIEENELEYVNNILDFNKKMGKDFMVPRNEIVLIEESIKIKDLMVIINKENYTRYPVYKNDKDNIIGYINVKELMVHYYNNKGEFDINVLINPILHFLETWSIVKILEKLQEERSQIAILIDEYGGVSGLITMEDILEELVGEIRDEFDQEEKELCQEVSLESKKVYEVEGKSLIEDIEKELNISIYSEDDISTIGGLFLKYEVDEIELGDVILKVKEKDNLQIKSLFIEIKEESNLLEEMEIDK